MVKKRRTLTRKFIIGFVLITLVISASSIIVGINGYSDYIHRQYNDTAYDIAETVQTFFEQGEIDEYLWFIGQDETESVVETGRYQMILSQIYNLRKSMGANDIFVTYIDMEELDAYAGSSEGWLPLTYLFDTYVEEEKLYHFGEKGPFNPEFISDVISQLKSGGRADNYFISKSEYGYNTSAILPFEQDGQTLPVIVGVEIPMSTLGSAITSLTIHTIGMIVLVMAVVIICFVLYLYRNVIRPIDVIAGEAEAFGNSRQMVSDKLQGIKTGDEIQTLSESILLMEKRIIEYVAHIRTVTAEKERISAELNVATQIQADMLPSIFPAFPERKEFDIYATMNPAKEVGGDFYDFFLVDDDHLAMVMADVSGKGVPAALFMVIAKTLIKNRTQMGGNPAEILKDVNEQLCEGNEAELFVTVWLAVFEISTGKGIAVNAGHEHPVIKRAGGEFELVVYRHSPAVAAMEGIRFREHEFELHPGDTLYVYTDGVPEATNAKDELYGTDRMLDVLNKRKAGSVEELLHSVKEDIDHFTGTMPQFDDITMLGFYYSGLTEFLKENKNEGIKN